MILHSLIWGSCGTSSTQMYHVPKPHDKGCFPIDFTSREPVPRVTYLGTIDLEVSFSSILRSQTIKCFFGLASPYPTFVSGTGHNVSNFGPLPHYTTMVVSPNNLSTFVLLGESSPQTIHLTPLFGPCLGLLHPPVLHSFCFAFSIHGASSQTLNLLFFYFLPSKLRNNHTVGKKKGTLKETWTRCEPRFPPFYLEVGTI